VFIMLGMVGYFVGVVQTPLTGFIIVMEMTNDHSLLLPLMATSFIAFGVSRLVCKKPIYVALARAFLAPPGAVTGVTAEPVAEPTSEKS
jgi:H+/Cl- antiporter ClcA